MELGFSIKNTYNPETKLYENNLEPHEVTDDSVFLLGKEKQDVRDTLIRLALDDIYNNEPVVFFGSDGRAIDEIISKIPKERQHSVLYINPTIQPFGLNILNGVENKSLFTVTLMEALKGIWNYDRTATPTLDQYLRAGIMTLLHAGDASLLSLKPLLTNDEFRGTVLGELKDEVLKDFWRDFKSLPEKDKRTEISSTLNKLTAFSIDPVVRNCIGQKGHYLSFNQNIVLVDLDESLLGKENARLLGAIILTQLFLDGVDDLYTNLYIEGAPRYGNAILGNILTHCQNIISILSAQYLDEFDVHFRESLLATMEHIVAFRTSYLDADTLQPEFNLKPLETQLFKLQSNIAYARIGGSYSYQSLYMFPNQREETKQVRKIIKRCSAQCTEKTANIEKRIRDLYGHYVEG